MYKPMENLIGKTCPTVLPEAQMNLMMDIVKFQSMNFQINFMSDAFKNQKKIIKILSHGVNM